MKRELELSLVEEVLLLALRDEKGTLAPGAQYLYATGGAILAELLLLGKIEVDGKGKRPLAQVADPSPTGDAVLDTALERVRTAKRRASLQTWVSRFANTRSVKHEVAAALCRRNILREDEKRVALFFKSRVYPEVDPVPERRMIERLRRAIFTDSSSVEPQTAVLVSLANATGLLRVVFDGKQGRPDRKALRGRRKRIEQIVNGEVAGKATKQAIEAMQAAVMVAAIIPAVTVATMSSH